MKRPPSPEDFPRHPLRGPTLSCLLLALMLTACGNRGPLYLPEPGDTAGGASTESPAPAGTGDPEGKNGAENGEDDDDGDRGGKSA